MCSIGLCCRGLGRLADQKPGFDHSGRIPALYVINLLSFSDKQIFPRKRESIYFWIWIGTFKPKGLFREVRARMASLTKQFLLWIS